MAVTATTTTAYRMFERASGPGKEVAREGRDDGVLHRSRRAETSVRELLHAREDVVQSRRPSDRHPSGAPAGREIRLRQRGERNDRRVGIQTRHRRYGPVVGEIAVDFVGE